MQRKYVASLIAFVLLAFALLSRAQDAPSGQKPGSGTGQSGATFPAMSLKTHGTEWKMQSGGQLTVANGSIEFRNPKDATDSFACQIGDVRSVEKRRGPMRWRVVRIKLKNGQKFDLVPFPDDFSHEAMEPIADAMEKSIRDMASAHGVVLK
ncbi:MAG TPA: hypothetical protein VEI49_04945 [Terriglobales bacterium]|nr:hypothetical protein [Terriglobales bacterium]